MKIEITTAGDLMLTDNKLNETSNFTGNKDDLIKYLNLRIEAMTNHIKFLEEECSSLYTQVKDCECNLTIDD